MRQVSRDCPVQGLGHWDTPPLGGVPCPTPVRRYDAANEEILVGERIRSAL